MYQPIDSLSTLSWPFSSDFFLDTKNPTLTEITLFSFSFPFSLQNLLFEVSKTQSLGQCRQPYISAYDTEYGGTMVGKILCKFYGEKKKKKQGGSRTTCLACFRDHILLHSL